MSNEKSKYDQYLEKFRADQRSAYSKMKGIGLDDYGYWTVYGDSCDGPTPRLGVYEGKLSDVISYAVLLPGFWGWGCGSVEPLTVTKITNTSAQVYKELQQRAEDLAKELANVQTQLKGATR